jgi:ArsR family transcriptional regulator, arsenate/arsenite/antimonite-responsive transcriptional repressor
LEEPVAIDDVFRALGDPTRREVLRLLRESGSMTAGEIAERFHLAKSTMSAHFNALRQAGLIVSERQGQQIVYSLHESVVEEAIEAMLRLFRVGDTSPIETKEVKE